MPSAQPRKQPLYFVNAWVDFMVIGLLSILTFIGLRLFNTNSREDVFILGIGLSYVCNWPHFSATNYRLYHARENIMQYPMTALMIPWVLLAGVVASYCSPLVVAPFFVKLMFVWSPYHFSGQSLGISLIYARRAGVQFSKLERFALAAFIYSTFIDQTVRTEVVEGAAPSFFGDEISYPGFGLPLWSRDVSMAWMYAMAALLVFCVVRWCVRNKRLIPGIVLLPALAQYIWFVPSSNWASFAEFVPFFHCLQYLLIAWSMQLKEKLDRNQIQPSRRYVISESARWGILNIIGGVCLFVGLPWLVANLGFGPGDGQARWVFASGVLLAAVQIHHFFVDGVIWKLKRKTVASPLMVNLDDLLHPQAPAQPQPQPQPQPVPAAAGRA